MAIVQKIHLYFFGHTTLFTIIIGHVPTSAKRERKN
jgi:hypothetical protein